MKFSCSKIRLVGPVCQLCSHVSATTPLVIMFPQFWQTIGFLGEGVGYVSRNLRTLVIQTFQFKMLYVVCLFFYYISAW